MKIIKISTKFLDYNFFGLRILVCEFLYSELQIARVSDFEFCKSKGSRGMKSKSIHFLSNCLVLYQRSKHNYVKQFPLIEKLI